MSNFPPDSPLVNRVAPSPNHGPRAGGVRPDILLLHYTGMASTDAALKQLCDPKSKVSSHYLICEDGRIVQLVPEARRAWHAGVSSWEGKTDINSRSIGIEIANPGHDFGYPDFPEVQIKAVIALCQDIVLRHPIRADRVLGHSDVAPARKQDPGEKFPWRRLADEGVGLAPKVFTLNPEDGRLTFGDGAHGKRVSDLQGQLAKYGYGVGQSGNYDGETHAVVTAFQRHFRPERVDGRADPSTIKTLRALLKAQADLKRQVR